MLELATFVRRKAEIIRSMAKAGWITDEEMELIRLAGLDLDKEIEEKEPFKKQRTREYPRKPSAKRKTRKSVRETREPKKETRESQKKQSTLILLSDPNERSWDHAEP
jgi:hypothetical protein